MQMSQQVLTRRPVDSTASSSRFAESSILCCLRFPRGMAGHPCR